MRLPWLALIVCVAGCEVVFPLVTTGPDAAPIDAAIDAAPAIPCPNGYLTLLGAPSTSLYKFVNSTISWNAAEAKCRLDDTVHPITHLAVPNTSTELSSLQNGFASGGLAGQVAWVGVARTLAGSDTPADFFEITGGPSPTDLWDVGQPGTTSMQNRAAVSLSAGAKLVNEPSLGMHSFICECDQLPPTKDFGLP